jgi:hypothetical protein
MHDPHQVIRRHWAVCTPGHHCCSSACICRNTCSLNTTPPLPPLLQTSKGWLLLYSLHISKNPVLPHSSSHWSGAEQLQALRSVDVYIKHPLRCEHSAPPSCLCCDSQSILVAYADGCLGTASWLGKVGH